MIKYFPLTFLFCSLCTFGFSQSAGSISGQVTDQSNGAPVAYASVAVYPAGSDEPISGSTSDENGNFKVGPLDFGAYSVAVTFVGYETQKRDNIILSAANPNVTTGPIALKATNLNLEEVEIIGKKELIEEKVDRTVYHAEKDKTTLGGDATDVMRRVPMVSVDFDGNVSVRGSQNVKILIDNKPSTITSGNVGDALKQIPADQIKSIEVITSPSARYDAEGTGGIINIVTKKNNLQGASLNIDTGIGLRSSNLGLNGNLRTGKWGFSLGGFGRATYNVHGDFTNKQTINPYSDAPLQTIQSADNVGGMAFGRYHFGADYEINELNWISAGVNFGTWNRFERQENFSTQSWQYGDLIRNTEGTTRTKNLSNTIDLSLNYIKQFKDSKKELSILGLYSRNQNVRDFSNKYYDLLADSQYQTVENENDSYNHEATLQADYIVPIGETQIFEAGLKNIFRMASSEYSYIQSDGSALPGNDFSYEQNVAAAYTAYTLQAFKNYTFKGGLRYEYTSIEASFAQGEKPDIPAYGVLVPSVNVARKFENGTMLKAAYNRRIQRPSIRYLNPYIQITSPLNATIGNPQLDPEYTDNFELGYSTYFDKVALNFSGFYRTTNNSIQEVRDNLGDTIRTTYANIGREEAYGLSMFVNVDIGKKISLNGGVDAYYSIMSNESANTLYAASNEGWVLNGRFFGNYRFAPGWYAQVFSYVRGPRVRLQGTEGGFYVYSLTINKEFNEGRGSIGVGAENFFQNEMVINSEMQSPVLIQESTTTRRNLNLKLNFTYKIGKLTVDPQQRKRRSKKIENEDMKGAETAPGGF